MMEKLSDSIDPLTGLRTLTGHHEGTNRFVVKHEQDLEPHIEMARAMRNDDDYWRQGVKAGWAHAAHIPDVVIIELRQLGIDVYSAPWKDIHAGLHRIGKEHFITTTKRVV